VADGARLDACSIVADGAWLDGGLAIRVAVETSAADRGGQVRGWRRVRARVVVAAQWTALDDVRREAACQRRGRQEHNIEVKRRVGGPDADEMQTRCRRDADEMQTRCRRDADEMQTRCGPDADERLVNIVEIAGELDEVRFVRVRQGSFLNEIAGELDEVAFRAGDTVVAVAT
jgi:hypothetical protein